MKWYQREWVWMAGFWLTYLVLRLTVVQMYSGPFLFRLGVELIEMPLKILAVYTVIYLLIGKLLMQQQYIRFTIFSILSIIVVMWLNRLEDYYILYPLTGIFYVKYELGFWSWRAAFFNLIYLYPVVGFGSAVFFVRSWFENQLAKERLARENAEIELKSLKDQIHPHFLFNTLNNIYALSLAQSKQTPEMMLRLSKLLSYMIYDSRSVEVPLVQEIQALKDCVELERIRLGERLEISFETEGPVEKISLAPLLLFPLLENCFKHGSHQTTEKIWIRFFLSVKPEQVSVQIENSLPTEMVVKSQQRGVGLANVKKRLAMLYPQHELQITEGETYLVQLKITKTWFAA